MFDTPTIYHAEGNITNTSGLILQRNLTALTFILKNSNFLILPCLREILLLFKLQSLK